MIRTENTKRTLERKFWSSGWISLWVLAYSYERHWYLFSLFLRQKKVFVCFASICTISPCLKFLQGFYWKKKISSYLYTIVLLKEHATFCKIKLGQRVTNRYMLHYLLPHLTARLTLKKKTSSLYNYYHFWIWNDWRTQKACKSCYYGQEMNTFLVTW